MFPEYLATEAELDHFLASFEDGTFPKEKWTHGAHVAMAACYVLALPESELLDRTRERIKYYNVCQGGQNTDDAGYHETLTVFWLAVVGRYLRESCDGLARLAAVRGAFTEFSTRSGLWREYYGFDVVKSREARRDFVAPDLRPIS